MRFIAILLALAVERYWPGVQNLRDMALFERYARGLRTAVSGLPLLDGKLGVVAVFLPVVIVVVWIDGLLSRGFLSLFGLVFGVLALMASLGPRDLLGLARRYLEAERGGDSLRADAVAAQILDEPMPVDPQIHHGRMVVALLAKANDWFPAVVFWFALLGPVGAVGYRLASVLRDQCRREISGSKFCEAAERLHAILAWAPARLTALAYALMGSFDDTLRAWRQAVAASDGSLRATPALLIATGLAALRLDRDAPMEVEQVRAVAQLLQRMLIAWLALAALLSLFGILK